MILVVLQWPGILNEHPKTLHIILRRDISTMGGKKEAHNYFTFYLNHLTNCLVSSYIIWSVDFLIPERVLVLKTLCVLTHVVR